MNRMMKNKLYAAFVASLLATGTAMVPGVARAGVDGTTAKIEAAIVSGSPDAILSELERAEYIPASGAITSVIALIDHPNDRVREAAGWWLTRRNSRATVITMAQTRLAGQDPLAAGNVLDALRGMNDVSTLDMIGAYVAHPLDESSGISALRALAAIGSPKGLPLLVPALSSTLVGVRAQALRAVRDLRAPIGQKVVSTGAPFLAALTDSDDGVRREAALTLGYLGQGGQNPDLASSGVTALIGVVQSDSSARVRKAAAWALGEIGNATALAALQKARNDSDSQVRAIATAASARLN